MKILSGGSILERVENANGMVLIKEYECGSESHRTMIFWFKILQLFST